MERVSAHDSLPNQAYQTSHSNECNVVIIAACIPTLRPLLLVIFKRPGRNQYLQRKPFGPSSSSRDRPRRVGRISAPTSDSTTAIGHADNEDSWIELGSDQHSSHNNHDIRQTLEVDVTSQKSTANPAEEDMFRMAGRNAV